MTIIRHPEAPPSACADCHARGHYCPGTVTAEGGKVFLCFACDAGEPCAHSRRPATATERVDALAERAENGNHRAALKAARVLKTRSPKPKEPKMSPVSRIAQAGRSLRERFDHDETEPVAEPEPQAAAEPDLPPAVAPQAENILFDPANRASVTYVTGTELRAARLDAISTVIRDLEAEVSRLCQQVRELDELLENLNKTRARWATPNNGGANGQQNGN